MSIPPKQPWVAIVTDPPPGENHRAGLAYIGWTFGSPDFGTEKYVPGWPSAEDALDVIGELPQLWRGALTVRRRKEENKK